MDAAFTLAPVVSFDAVSTQAWARLRMFQFSVIAMWVGEPVAGGRGTARGNWKLKIGNWEWWQVGMVGSGKGLLGEGRREGGKGGGLVGRDSGSAPARSGFERSGHLSEGGRGGGET